MANTANSNTLTTDFNVTPYYDDYDDTKNFHRILFKPGYAVQARELTQLQTILQNQVDRFGKHIFKEGSLVLGGLFSIDTAAPYVKVNDTNDSNLTVNINDFEGQVVTGQTTGVKAYIQLVKDGVQSNTNTKTIYVKYLSSGTSYTDTTFAADEVLTSNVGNLVVHSTTPTGLGSTFTIEEGVFFAKQHFISFQRQSIVLDRYSTNPSCQVGFNITEEIISASTDSSLLDPALESSNYSAPGADRFKLNPQLVSLSLTEVVGPPDYVALFSIEGGVVQVMNDRPVYNIIRDEIAKRTMDESGDYYVRGLDINVREHLDNGTNGGFSNTGNSTSLAIGIEPGLAYVKGYEINNLVTKYVEVEKATSYANINNEVTSTSLGSWITANNFVGSLPLDYGYQINLYDTAMQRIIGRKWSTTSQSGKLIGKARVKSIEYSSGTLGTATGNVKLYLFDVTMNGTNSFANVRSFYSDNNTLADVGGDFILNTSNNAALSETTLSPLLYPLGSNFTKTIRSSDGSVDTSFTFKRTSNVSISANGTFTVPITTGSDEIYPYGTGSMSSTEKQTIILSLNEAFNIDLPGTVGGSNNSNTITGTSTFFTRLNVGDKLEFSNVGGPSGTYIITSVANNTSLTVTPALNSDATSNVVVKAYKTGDIVDLSTIGVDAGTSRSVTTTTSSLTFDLKESLGTSRSATINYHVTRTTARETAKTLRVDRFVKVNCTAIGNTAGPFNLGISDVYKIKEIRANSGPMTANTEGSDVTAYFKLDKGQRDDFYGYASILPSGISLASTPHLLVRLDYFIPDFTLGVGYFSIDSYPINDTNPSATEITTAQIPRYRSTTTNKLYDLRNYIDFRPVYVNSAADSTTVAGATTNPSSATAFYSEANGLRLPVDSTQVTYDYSYYLSRIDMVVADKDANFSVIKGVPAVYPLTPSISDNVMGIARVFVPAYPSLAPEYAAQLDRKDISCSSKKLAQPRFTMHDIGRLQQRITNLEYYTSLNILEKSAADLKILDENGIDRFKNGIFTDTFVDHSLGARDYDSNYSITVDPEEKSIRPIYTMDSVPYNYISGTNVVKKEKLVILPYTETPFINQPYATTYRNNETAIYKFIGKLYLNPPDDFWVDTQYDSALNINLEGASLTTNTVSSKAVSTVWNAWQKNIVGYSVIISVTWDRDIRTGQTERQVQTFSAYEQALDYYNRMRLERTIGAGQAGGSISLEESSVYSRTGTETIATTVTGTQSMGTRVTNVDVIPYIRPQTIEMRAVGLKAGTRYHVFFDGENMNSYASPAVSPAGNYVFVPSPGTSANSSIGYNMQHVNSSNNVTQQSLIQSGSEGSVLVSSTTGELTCLLRLPTTGKQFRTGSKEVVVTDSPSNESDATSYAITNFTAQGIRQYKQDTILSTREVFTASKSISETYNDVAVLASEQLRRRGGSCMAYSFMPRAPSGEEGLFITSVDIYLSSKDPNYGIWVELREMDKSGGITDRQVPGSEVWLKSSELTVSTNASIAQNIKFPMPVFLYNNTQYAFVIHTEAVNPNTYLWVSKLGQTDVTTGDKVISRAYTGTLYMTNNNLNWDIVPDFDLKCNFYRASFDTGVVGQVILGNLPIESVTANTISSPLIRYGEVFNTNDKLTLSGATGTINTTDLLIGVTSNANSAVTVINGSVYTMSNTGYTSGEQVTVSFANGTSKGVVANVASKKTGTAILRKYNDGSLKKTALLYYSNGNFSAGDTLIGSITGSTAIVETVDSLKYSTIDFECSYLTFGNTSCQFEMRAVSNTGTVGNYTAVDVNKNYSFDQEQALFSRGVEYSTLSGAQSNRVRATLSTTTSYLSPVIDLAGTHSVYVHNLVNSNTTNETAATGGALINKYISKVTTLAEGQDAEDLRVIITAYRPINTDVKLWARVSNAEDYTPITDSPWIPLDYLNSTVYSKSSDRNDFIEYSFKFPSSYMTGPLSEFQYTNSDGITFTGFKQFAIKIGLLSDDSAIVPRVADLRVIALQI